MIIVSQDKDNMVNFDNIVSIGIEDFDSISSWQRITAETLGTAVVLGDYKTEKRAKEVLIEIMQSYVDSENYKYLNGRMRAEELNRLQKGLVHEMPKE